MLNDEGRPSAPGKPLNVTLVYNGDGTATVDGDPPTSGAPILRYRVLLSTGETDTDSALPITVSLDVGSNRDTITAVGYATNSEGEGPASDPSNSITPQLAGTVEFTVLVTFPIGTVLGTGNAYQVRDSDGTALTGWIDVGLITTPNMTGSADVPPAQSITWAMSPNEGTQLCVCVVFRSAASEPVYEYAFINKGSGGKCLAGHRFLPSDTNSAGPSWDGGLVTVQVFTNNGTMNDLDIPETTTGVFEISEVDKVYGYLVSLPSENGGLLKGIEWGTGGGTSQYDLGVVRVPFKSSSGSTPFLAAVQFPSTVTPSGAKYLMGDQDGDVGTWGTAGMVAAPNANGFTIAGERSTPAYIRIRSDDAGTSKDLQAINVQNGSMFVSVAPFTEVDAISSLGWRLYENSGSGALPVGAHSSDVIEIDGIANGYVAFVPLAGTFDGFLLWDGAAIYAQDAISFLQANVVTQRDAPMAVAALVGPLSSIVYFAAPVDPEHPRELEDIVRS